MKSKSIISVVLLPLAVVGAMLFFFQQPSKPESSTSPIVMPQMSELDLASLKAKAAAGDPVAQTSLGKIYLAGTSVKADMKEAAKWFQLAADKNHPEALAALGELTQAGQGAPRNLGEAARLYRRAAENGSVAGQYNLAYLYEQGSGVPQDDREAAKWYELAAEGGDPIAQYDIGQRYKLGVGVATNRVQAFKWLTLAAAQSQADSAKLLPEVKRELSGDELTQARQLVKEFHSRPPKNSGPRANLH